jgi:hypothetical protein
MVVSQEQHEDVFLGVTVLTGKLLRRTSVEFRAEDLLFRLSSIMR